MTTIQKRKCDFQKLNQISINLPKEAFAPEARTFWFGVLFGATAFAILAKNSN